MINNSAAFLEFVDAVISAPYEPLNDPNVWMVKESRYNKLRWFAHCAKVYPEPTRKLRKCVMRRMVRRRKSERKRYE
jgi:hypothetical protein